MKRKRWITGLLAIIVSFGLMEVLPLESQAEPEAAYVRDTLENEAFIAGDGEAGAQIQCSVYTVENGKTTLLYQTETVVGASGLYQLTVPLPVLGIQYVTVAVEEEETTYVYHRYRKQFAKELDDFYLNIYQVLDEE